MRVKISIVADRRQVALVAQHAYPLDYLTFWSRKSAADQISQWGHSTAFIGAVSSIVRSSDLAPNQSQIVLVGHSLGARILFSAVSQH